MVDSYFPFCLIRRRSECRAKVTLALPSEEEKEAQPPTDARRPKLKFPFY